MGAQREEKTDSHQTAHQGIAVSVFTSARTFALGHRKVMAVATVSAITAVIIVPYITHAGINNFANVVTGQPVSQELHQAKDRSEMNQQEQKIEQPTSGQTTVNSSNNSSTNVTVNGQQIPVPENGTYSKTTVNSSGSTEVKVESKQSSMGDDNSSSNSSSVHLNVHSDSSSSSSD